MELPMKFTKTSIISISVLGLLLSGCVQADGTSNKTVIGAGTGAIIGGLLGKAVGDDEKKATRNGALLGGAVGALVGNELDKQEAELRSGLSGSGASIVNNGDRLVVTLPEAITFATGSSEVKSSLYNPLAQIAASLNNYPNTIAQIVGHTDNVGSNGYNQALSERRAGAVASILKNAGTASSRVSIVGRGESAPIASNGDAAGRQANRRVEINIIPVQ